MREIKDVTDNTINYRLLQEAQSQGLNLEIQDSSSQGNFRTWGG